MNSSKNYYSSSLLSAYLSEPEPCTHVHASIPDIQVDEPHASNDSIENGNHQPSKLDSFELSPGTRDSHVSSVSSNSTIHTPRYSISEMSDDLDLQSLRLTMEKFDIEEPHRNKFQKLRQRLLGKEKLVQPSDEDERFFSYVTMKLKAQHYQSKKGLVLDFKWSDAAEVFLFGDTINNLFTCEAHLLNYLVESSRELGEVRFSNLTRYHADTNLEIDQLLRNLSLRLKSLNCVLDQYALSGDNIGRPELYETFSKLANFDEGLCIPIAIAMFGNWLLTFNKDEAITSNYENTLILDYFRKAARVSLVLRRAKSLFDEKSGYMDKSDCLSLDKYLGKDNDNALAISLHGLGEYYQYSHNYDIAVTLWEINCHLTGDSELGQLAILGLTDGFGLGNQSKEHNRFGKRSKSKKFNTKRRIAHLYRILMKSPDFNEYGTSWVTKEKYN